MRGGFFKDKMPETPALTQMPRRRRRKNAAKAAEPSSAALEKGDARRSKGVRAGSLAYIVMPPSQTSTWPVM